MDKQKLIEKLTFITPPECQGQFVEYSYAQSEDGVFRLIFDGHDRSRKLYFVPWDEIYIHRWTDLVPVGFAPSACCSALPPERDSLPRGTWGQHGLQTVVCGLAKRSDGTFLFLDRFGVVTGIAADAESVLRYLCSDDEPDHAGIGVLSTDPDNCIVVDRHHQAWRFDSEVGMFILLRGQIDWPNARVDEAVKQAAV